MCVKTQVQQAPVYLNTQRKKCTQQQQWLSRDGVHSLWGSSPLGHRFHSWHLWHGAFLPDWWPHMTDGVFHAYNQLNESTAVPRDQKAEVVNWNVKEQRRNKKARRICSWSLEWIITEREHPIHHSVSRCSISVLPGLCVCEALFLIQLCTPVSVVIYEARTVDGRTQLRSSSWVS